MPIISQSKVSGLIVTKMLLSHSVNVICLSLHLLS